MFQELRLEVNSGVVEIWNQMAVHFCPGLNRALDGTTSAFDLVGTDGIGCDNTNTGSELNQILVV
jgi:hypothetical protein